MIRQGDLLLVPFPFSDQSGKKVRPVIVISNDAFNEHSDDLIVIGVTSSGSMGRHTLDFSNKDLDEGELYLKCYIKVENILKLDNGLVVKKIGKVKKAKMQAISRTLHQIISVEK